MFDASDPEGASAERAGRTKRVRRWFGARSPPARRRPQAAPSDDPAGSFITAEHEAAPRMASTATGEPDDDLATAIGQYVLGEISLGRAAEQVDMTRWELEELLEEAGFTALYGPRSVDELEHEVDAALDLE